MGRIVMGLLWLIVGTLALVILYRVVPIPVTPLMLIRLAEGHGITKTWTPLEAMSPYMPYAAAAAEDNLFCQHDGFDWKAINRAYAHWQRREEGATNAPLKGGSTISQQTAKNVFLWPGRSFIRKGLEVPFTVLIENLWGKRRIMEVYLNVAEFGPGIYGVAAAAKYHFNTTPRRLTARQAALLASVLPSPRRWSAGKPGPYVQKRAWRTQTRIRQLGPMLSCVR